METVEGEKRFGHARLGGIGQRLEHEIESRTGFESRAAVLGHIQRGEPRPSTGCSPPGWAAPTRRRRRLWTMPALKGTRIGSCRSPTRWRTCAPCLSRDYAAAETFFG